MSRNTRRKPEVQQLDDRSVPAAAVASVTGVVFADLNASGAREATEPTLAGVPVILRSAADNSVEGVTASAADGTFTLAGLADGTHLLTVSPTGNGVNGADVVRSISIQNGQSVGPVAVGVTATGSVSGTAYVDVNGNGRRDAGEAGVPGAVASLALYGSSTSTPLTATAGADGGYRFTSVPDGAHKLTVTAPGGAVVGPTTVSVVGGANASVVDVALPASSLGGGQTVPTTTVVSGTVTLAGALDNPALAGLTVSLDSNYDGKADLVATTDAAGGFRFAGVPVGNGVAEVSVVTTGSSTAANRRTLTLTSPATAAGNFPIAYNGTITGSSFIDNDGNGKYAAGDQTIIPATVQLDLNNSGTLVSLLAMAGTVPGSYKVSGVPDGTHTLVITPPGGYKATTPTRLPVTVASGGAVVVADVGYRAAGGSTVAIGNGDQAGATVYTFSTKADGSLTATQGNVTTPAGKSASTRTVSADVNGDGVDDLITAAGPGGAPVVRIFDGRTGTELVANGITVFESSFVGGLNLSAGDFLKTGRAQIVVSADVGGGPRVKVIRPDPVHGRGRPDQEQGAGRLLRHRGHLLPGRHPHLGGRPERGRHPRADRGGRPGGRPAGGHLRRPDGRRRGRPGAEIGNREQSGTQIGPIANIAADARDEAQIEFRRCEQHRQRPRVVDVRADVGIENDRSRHCTSPAFLPSITA